jgi:hypothetical protein
MARVRSLTPETAAFYREALEALAGAGIPFLIGGSHAFQHHTGIARNTKDLDVFLRQQHLEPALRSLAAFGCHTEITFPHWLGKAYRGEDLVDVIFASGNGVAVVDELWFQHASRGDTLGLEVSFCPAEEMIWSKAFIMERERFDGADVLHLIQARAAGLDWERLLRRFDGHWPVLLAHLVLFGFVFPAHAQHVPDGVLKRLLNRLDEQRRGAPAGPGVCRGTLLSRAQYLVDIEERGLADARLGPETNMTPEDIQLWTEGIAKDGSG